MTKPPIKKLRLKAMLPQTTQINKPLIIVFGAITAFIIIFGVMSAFDNLSATKSNQQHSDNIHNDTFIGKMGGSQSTPLPASLNNLPQNYQDITAIKKYAPDLNGNNKLIMELQHNMENLEQESIILEKEVAKLQQEPNYPSPASHIDDQQTQQAKSAGIFFSNISQTTIDTGSTFKNSDTTPITTSSSTAGASANMLPTTTDLQVQKLSATAQTAFYHKQNMLNQKLAVLKAIDNPEDIYDLHNVVQPVSDYEIQAGNIIPAVLLTGINTSLTGTVVAQSRFNVYDSVTGKYLLIPRGSRIIGDYDAKVSYGQRRVLLTFSRIIRPDGTSILLGKPLATDLQGQAGMEGKVDNHWGKILAAATLSTMLSIGAGIAADNSGGDNAYYQSSKQGAILGAANNIAQIGSNITNHAFDMQPTITLNPGYQFNIIVRRDMVLSPLPLVQ